MKFLTQRVVPTNAHWGIKMDGIIIWPKEPTVEFIRASCSAIGMPIVRIQSMIDDGDRYGLVQKSGLRPLLTGSIIYFNCDGVFVHSEERVYYDVSVDLFDEFDENYSQSIPKIGDQEVLVDLLASLVDYVRPKSRGGD